MFCGGGRKRLPPCRFRGNGLQGCHFHNEVFDSVADGDTGLREQGCLMQPQARCPRRTRREKDKPSIAHVREATFVGKRSGHVVAQSSIQRIQNARACSERVEGGALRDLQEAARWALARGRALLQGGTYSANAMNIIIVAKSHSAPRCIDLGSRRGRVLAGGALGIIFTVCAGVGFGAAVLTVNPRDAAIQELASVRAVIEYQKTALDALQGDSRRNLDALALQLGQLRAQATRLNALGDRLTQVGKLDDGEFDFAAEPALGGPEELPESGGAPLPLGDDIDNLRAEFVRQEAQLGMLENLLFDRKIDNALLPTGMPVAHGYVVSGYGSRTDPLTGRQAMHLGVDFDVPLGSDVLAVAEGVVTYADTRNGYGNTIEIDHGNGYMTRYAHNSRNVVELGTRVHVGQVVAKVGSSGRSTGPHCHFEVWLNGRPVNPMAYVRSTRVPRA